MLFKSIMITSVILFSGRFKKGEGACYAETDAHERLLDELRLTYSARAMGPIRHSSVRVQPA